LTAGGRCLALKRVEQALASCDQAIALEPDPAQAYNDCGFALSQLKRVEEALASADFAHPYYNRACALEQKVPSLVLLVCQYEIGNSFYRVFSILHLSWGGVDRSTIVFICRIGSAGNRGRVRRKEHQGLLRQL